MKKRGFGAERYNGFGGKVETSDRSVRDAAAREALEECCIIVNPEDLEDIGRLYFRFENSPIMSEVFVFLAENYQGDPQETEEMAPEWFHFNDVPFAQMWPR